MADIMNEASMPEGISKGHTNKFDEPHSKRRRLNESSGVISNGAHAAPVSIEAPLEDPEAASLDPPDSPDYTGLEELFRLDQDPEVKLSTEAVPSYRRTLKDIIPAEAIILERQQQNSANECRRERRGGACFNCGKTGHAIRDCDQPRNDRRIQRSKKAFAQSSTRYHLETEQRFAHIRPGVISRELRRAMDLQRGEVPFFFYRMRALGYPPAWLADARVAKSGLELITTGASESSDATSSGPSKYDASKIVDFPGFNFDPGRRFYDDYRRMRVAPLHKYDMKERFVQQLGLGNIIRGYKRKRIDESEAQAHSLAADVVVADMEIDDDELPAGTEVTFARPPPPPPEDELSLTDDGRSLAELEAEQQRLLQELLHGTSTATEESFSPEVMELSATSNATNSSALECGFGFVVDAMPSSVTEEEQEDESIAATSTAAVVNDVEEILNSKFIGTPLVKFSPYEVLPNGQNFSVGVSDVINFENLPDSTGMYEHMKCVLKKVRRTIQKLHRD